MARYRIAANVEWTSKCNARCVMCPREALPSPRIMRLATFARVLDRLSPRDIFRAVIAGYGEPTTHPRFDALVDLVRDHPVIFDMVTNGQLLDEARLERLDGAIGTLIVSFSSIDPEVYRRVHVNLDRRRVMDNILLARDRFRRTRLAISLTPMPECLATLDQTIAWFRDHGIASLTMSPSLYDRAGSQQAARQSSAELRAAIRRHGLHSQELDFVPSAAEIFAQWRANRFKCIPRNTDVLISAEGDYMYCFNDISHSHALGNVADMDIREALNRREKTAADDAICGRCDLRHRYGFMEIVGAAIGFAKLRLGQAL